MPCPVKEDGQAIKATFKYADNSPHIMYKKGSAYNMNAEVLADLVLAISCLFMRWAGADLDT